MKKYIVFLFLIINLIYCEAQKQFTFANSNVKLKIITTVNGNDKYVQKVTIVNKTSQNIYVIDSNSMNFYPTNKHGYSSLSKLDGNMLHIVLTKNLKLIKIIPHDSLSVNIKFSFSNKKSNDWIIYFDYILEKDITSKNNISIFPFIKIEDYAELSKDNGMSFYTQISW